MFRLEKVDKSILKTIHKVRKCWFPSQESGLQDFDLFEVPVGIYRKKFPTHDIIKDELLDLIEISPCTPSHFHDLNKHDWNVPRQYERPYGELFSKNLIEICKPFIKNYHLPRFEYWYNKYEVQKSQCYIHNHQNAVISGVYFLELENSKDSTIFISPNSKTGYQVPVREGDILLWNSLLPHLAPKTKGLKTIISFNLLAK